MSLFQWLLYIVIYNQCYGLNYLSKKAPSCTLIWKFTVAFGCNDYRHFNCRILYSNALYAKHQRPQTICVRSLCLSVTCGKSLFRLKTKICLNYFVLDPKTTDTSINIFLSAIHMWRKFNRTNRRRQEIQLLTQKHSMASTRYLEVRL